MSKRLFLPAISIIGTLTCFGQLNGDSIVALRKTETLDGKIKTVFSPGNKKVAKNLQKLLTEAAQYFEKEYSRKFNVKLAVLDSVQWTKEYSPYGYLLYRDGWMIMNTGMDFDMFKKVYRLQGMSNEIDSALKKNHMSADELITSFNNFYGVHELSHYFIYELTKVNYHDRFSDEFIATYLAYQFFYNTNKTSTLKLFELISGLNRDLFKPKYASIDDLVVFKGVTLANYLWYHSNFYFLAKDLYECKGKDFVSAYETIFSDPASSKLTTDETVNLLDQQCPNIIKNWAKALAARKSD